MDKFETADLRQLTEANEGPCITITLPTHVAGREGQQDAVRLKNLVDQVEQQLSQNWMRAPEARDLVAAIRDLPEEKAFWKNRSHGLALFLNPSSLRRFRVPLSLEELAVVNSRFHVKALLPLLACVDRFYVLALSQHDVRLFEATKHQIEQVDVAGLPQRMEDALNLDGADRGSQSHFAMKGGKGKQSSVFHGQGGVPDSHKEDVAHFFRLIDSALTPVLRDDTAPLILAGVDYLLPIFRKSCNYSNVAEPELTGNWDHASPQQLHEKAWSLVKPLFAETRRKAEDKYRQLAGTGKTTCDIHEATTAAVAGRVETLFVASDRHVWGACDSQGNIIDMHDTQQPGDDDLLDSIAVQTILHRGSVYAVDGSDVPSADAIAAVLRF